MKTLLKTTIVCALALGCGSLAMAQSLQVGENGQLHLLADAEYVYETNLFLRSINRVSDHYLIFSPGVELRLAEEGAASMTLRYQHQFTTYDKSNELNDDYANFNLSARYDSGLVMLSAYANYQELFSSTLDANRDGQLVERTLTEFGGSLKYGISQLTAVKIGLDVSDTDYDDTIYTDHESLSVPLTFFYQIRPRVDLTAGLRYRSTDTSSAIDFDDMYYFVGAVGELFSPVLYADVSFGYQKRDYDGVSLDADSASYDITLIYTGNAKATLYGGLARDYRTSAIGGLAYAFTSASLGARYNVSKSVGLNTALTYGESEYEESPRAEDMMILNFGASYHPNDYLTISARFEYTEVDGNNLGGASEYVNNEFRVTASLRY